MTTLDDMSREAGMKLTDEIRAAVYLELADDIDDHSLLSAENLRKRAEEKDPPRPELGTVDVVAPDRINVRRLMMFMKEAISESSRFMVFEPNHPQTWRALGRLINQFLQDIKDKGGLYDFAFQCDEETNTPAVVDRNEMVARVFVKPTKTAEFIELNFILTSTGADFKEIIKGQEPKKAALWEAEHGE